MKKEIKIIILILVLIATFLIVYSPHFKYRFPIHTDEWHAITEAMKIERGEYKTFGKTGWNAVMGFEAGFQIFLYAVSKFVNLVDYWKFFPALWAVFSALTLFFVVYKKTKNNFMIAVFAVIFFASIKSNVNLGGLWFFIPITFAIPFIFLYIYFFTEGMEKKSKKMILISIAFMIPLIFVHAVSVLFAVPFLIIYSLFHLSYLKKEYKFFLLFLIIPLAGFLFYAYMSHLALTDAVVHLMRDLQFKKGWGVYEIKNSPLEVYSLAGYILAIFGAFSILFYRKEKPMIAYLFWPLTLVASIAIFRFTGISYLSPYQRNFYYLVISLPLLSAIGLNFILSKIKLEKKVSEDIVKILVIIFAIFFTFYSYYSIPKSVTLYYPINEENYKALSFLFHMPPGKVLANPYISEAIYPIAYKEPVATLFFYGNQSITRSFFSNKNCVKKQEILRKNNVSYVLSETPINCPWEPIYSAKGNYIYSGQV